MKLCYVVDRVAGSVTCLRVPCQFQITVVALSTTIKTIRLCYFCPGIAHKEIIMIVSHFDHRLFSNALDAQSY